MKHTARRLMWYVLSGVVVLCVGVPLFFVLQGLWSPDDAVWAHVFERLLGHALVNTLCVVGGVLVGAGGLGLSLAWMVTRYDFPGKKWLEWMLLLPLAFPTYVLAFVYVGLGDDFSRTIRAAGYDLFGGLISFRSAWGMVLVMSLAFFPYVYFVVRHGLKTEGARLSEVAQTLGYGPIHIFLRVSLPICWPWIASGLMWVAFETISDFGTASICNCETLSVLVYKAWFGLFSFSAAKKLSALLFVIIGLVFLGDLWIQSRRRYTSVGSCASEYARMLKKPWAWAMCGYCMVVLVFAFFLPATQLGIWAAKSWEWGANLHMGNFWWHTFAMATLGALVTSGAALIILYTYRQFPHPALALVVKGLGMGYAIPGTILAVGILSALLMWKQGSTFSFLYYGTLLGVIVGYVVRFMILPLRTLSAAWQRIPRNFDESAETMNVSGFWQLMRLHLPLLRGGIGTALILLFIDMMREMPITLMLRPIGWETLSIRIFEMTSEGEWQRAALPALILLISGLIPIFFLKHQDDSLERVQK